MKVWVDPCLCIARFLNTHPCLPPEKLDGKSYEDEYCKVECNGGIIHAIAYAIAAGSRYKLNECTMMLW
ncbi:MAG: hypothetical protein RXR51_08420 [Nitrososphaeria archaeon]